MSETEIIEFDDPSEMFNSVSAPSVDYGFSRELEDKLREKAPDLFKPKVVVNDDDIVSVDDDRTPLEVLREGFEGGEEVMESEKVYKYSGEDYNYYCTMWSCTEIEFEDFDTSSFVVDEPENVFVEEIERESLYL